MDPEQQNSPSIEDLRSALYSARLKFDPSVQSLRYEALDLIIQQILFVASGERGLSDAQIHGAFRALSKGSSLQPGHVSESITRLIQHGKIVPDKSNRIFTYILTDEASAIISESRSTQQRNTNNVIKSLLPSLGENYKYYVTPFLDVLSMVFSRLGEATVKILTGSFEQDDIFESIKLSDCMESVENRYPDVDLTLLENTIFEFFKAIDPEYNSLKWNLAQNYFIAQSLGFGDSSITLSRELYQGRVFLLDTNILIEGLERRHEYHDSFLAFAKSCRVLDIQLAISQVTLNELRGWVAYQRELFSSVIDQIPESMEKDIRSLFYEIWVDSNKAGKNLSIDDLFKSFDSPFESLTSIMDVERLDDSWFDRVDGNAQHRALVDQLIKTSMAMPWKKVKNKHSASHDALMLMWANHKNSNGGKHQFLTTDTVLIGKTSLPWIPTKPAILMESFLQWLGPLSINGSDGSFSTVFANMIRNRVLPQEKMFHLSDFRIFNDLEMDCKALPENDVKGAISHIKNISPRLDMNDPNHRMKLYHEVARYFGNPSREYTVNLANLQSRIDELERASSSKFEEYESEVNVRDQKIGELEENLALSRDLAVLDGRKKTLRGRIAIFLGVYIVGIILLGFLANKFGEKNNIWQNILGSWPIILSYSGAALFIIRRQIKALHNLNLGG